MADYPGVTLEDFFKSQSLEAQALREKCWHGTLVMECSDCDKEAEKAILVDK